MVSKEHRFKGQNSVKYLFKKGGSAKSDLFTVRYLKNPKRKDYRAAVVVSKKITKSAPKRNRIRRRIYEIIRLNSPQYLQNHDIAIIVFSDKIADIPYLELEQDIVNCLKQIK